MTESSSTLIGRSLPGGIKITQFLGEGGFAEIYVAERGSPPTEVAVKVLNAELSSDETFVRRFAREAKTAISVAHPNAVRILEYGVDGKLAYIVMELVRGTSVSAVLRREGRLSQRRAVKITMQICDALGAAHDQGIVHRDIKPENVMLLGDPSQAVGEWVKVLDFGIAKLLLDDRGGGEGDKGDEPDSSRAALTRMGTVLGTPAYMAPEQALGGVIDARSDLYSCGILLYELVTGRLPFDGPTPAYTVMAHVQQPPPPPSLLLPDIHPDLERAIFKALAKSPGERHQEALELRDELAKLVPSLSDVATPMPEGAGRDRKAIEEAATVVATSAAALAAAPQRAAATPLAVPAGPAEHAPVAEPLAGPALPHPDTPAASRARGITIAFALVAVLVVAALSLGALFGR